MSKVAVCIWEVRFKFECSFIRLYSFWNIPAILVNWSKVAVSIREGGVDLDSSGVTLWSIYFELHVIIVKSLRPIILDVIINFYTIYKYFLYFIRSIVNSRSLGLKSSDTFWYLYRTFNTSNILGMFFKIYETKCTSSEMKSAENHVTWDDHQLWLSGELITAIEYLKGKNT